MAEESSALATSTKTPLPPAAKAAADAAVQSAIEKMAQTESSPSSYEEGKEEEGEVQTISIEGGLKKDITVFDSRQEFTVKHPLATTWTLWFDSASKQDKAKSWDEALVKIMDFDSVEEFWGYVRVLLVVAKWEGDGRMISWTNPFFRLLPAS